MDDTTGTEHSDEYGTRRAINGWYALGVMVIITVFGIVAAASNIYAIAVIVLVLDIFLVFGLFQLHPNVTAVATFFGSNKGNYSGAGLLWRNPLYNLIKVSTRSDITRTPVSKINDLGGNPIMAAMQGQWYVNLPASSVFNIDKSIDEYVADVFLYSIRRVVSEFSYDGHSSETPETPDDSNTSENVYLRTSSDKINERLQTLAQERLEIAGVVVVSANLVDLAYAPEIASAMLQVQQANAFLNARKTIVKGATGIALQALSDIQNSGDRDAEEVIIFDKHEKAALVSNLLVVLCGEVGAQPVISLNHPVSKGS